MIIRSWVEVAILTISMQSVPGEVVGWRRQTPSSCSKEYSGRNRGSGNNGGVFLFIYSLSPPSFCLTSVMLLHFSNIFYNTLSSREQFLFSATDDVAATQHQTVIQFLIKYHRKKYGSFSWVETSHFFDLLFVPQQYWINSKYDDFFVLIKKNFYVMFQLSS